MMIMMAASGCFCATVAECDDDDNDEDEAENENESNCQDASVVSINDSASVSPHIIADQSDEEPELDSSKSKLPKSGLRIKLSLKPVRKSSREHKAPVSNCERNLRSDYFLDVFDACNS